MKEKKKINKPNTCKVKKMCNFFKASLNLFYMNLTLETKSLNFPCKLLDNFAGLALIQNKLRLAFHHSTCTAFLEEFISSDYQSIVRFCFNPQHLCLKLFFTKNVGPRYTIFAQYVHPQQKGAKIGTLVVKMEKLRA